MLVFGCPQCDNRFELDDSLQGKRGRCAQCGCRFVIPGPGAPLGLLLSADQPAAGDTAVIHRRPAPGPGPASAPSPSAFAPGHPAAGMAAPPASAAARVVAAPTPRPGPAPGASPRPTSIPTPRPAPASTPRPGSALPPRPMSTPPPRPMATPPQQPMGAPRPHPTPAPAGPPAAQWQPGGPYGSPVELAPQEPLPLRAPAPPSGQGWPGAYSPGMPGAVPGMAPGMPPGAAPWAPGAAQPHVPAWMKPAHGGPTAGQPRGQGQPLTLSPAVFLGGGAALLLVIVGGIWFFTSGRETKPAVVLPVAKAPVEAAAESSAAASRPKLTPAEISEKYASAVVLIQNFGEDDKQESLGSGFVVKVEGVVVTNFHVIDGAKSLKLKRKDGKFFDVQDVLAFDSKKDFAILRVANPGDPSGWTTVVLGDSDAVKAGARVVTLGHSLGLEYTLSDGLCSGKRELKDEGVVYLQHSAPISGGNSGGPLFDESGEVIGINTLGSVVAYAQNLNFALPINDVKGGLSLGSAMPLSQAVAEGGKRSIGDLVRQGAALLKQGQSRHAYVLFKNAYEKDPKNLEAVLGYAECLRHVGQDHLAREKYLEALALQADSVQAFRGLGFSYLYTDDAPRSMLAFREALRRKNEDVATLFGMAATFLNLGSKKDATAHLTKACGQPSDQLELHDLIFAIFLSADLGEASKADQLLDRLPKDKSFDGTRRIAKGVIALGAGRVPEAVETLARAVEADPEQAFAHYQYARALRAAGKDDQAIVEYQHSITSDRSFYRALKELARLYDARKLLHEAVTYYRTCLSLNPGDLEANLRLAQILRDVGQADDSIPFLESALKNSPGYRPCQLALGEAYAAAGQREKACDLLAPLAKANPPDPEAKLALAEVYLDQGRANDALELVLSAQTAGPLLARKLALLGRTLSDKEKFDAAAACYEEAVALAPEVGTYRFERAVAYARYNVLMGAAALKAFIEWGENREEERQRRNEAIRLLNTILRAR